jgi:hypothetical protein
MNHTETRQEQVNLLTHTMWHHIAHNICSVPDSPIPVLLHLRARNERSSFNCTLLHATPALAVVRLPHMLTSVNLIYSLFTNLTACNGEETREWSAWYSGSVNHGSNDLNFFAYRYQPADRRVSACAKNVRINCGMWAYPVIPSFNVYYMSVLAPLSMERNRYRSFVPPYPSMACGCDEHTCFWQTKRCRVRLQGVLPSSHAERGILLRMSLAENMCESYSPQGIDVGTDFGNDRYTLLKTQERLHLVGFATPGARTDERDV